MQEDIKIGLSLEEVAKSLAEHGNNKIEADKQDSFFVAVFETIKNDAMIKILVFALLVETIFAAMGLVEPYEPIGISVAVILAVLIGTLSEYSAESQFRKLQHEASQIYVKVFRADKLTEILIGDIVKGDYILLQSGDKVPVDGYLVDGKLELNLAALNGETEPCSKMVLDKAVNWERYWNSNEDDFEESVLLNPYKIHRESVVSDGKAIMRAHKIGRETLIGQTVGVYEDDVESPLNIKLSMLAKNIAKFGYIFAVLIAVVFMVANIFAFGSINAGDFFGYFSAAHMDRLIADLVKAAVLAVIIVVVAVPEGLPLMTMLVLSLNMKKLLKDNVLVRKLIGIETAGSLNVLYTDKTGTITKGHLEVVNFFDGQKNDYNHFDVIPDKLKDILTLSIKHNSSSQVHIEKNGTLKVIGGNLTEKALATWGHHSSISLSVEKKESILFNSEYKFSAQQVVVDAKEIVLVKGAPEVLSNCKFYYDPEGNKQTLPEKDLSELRAKINELAGRQIRVIAIAICEDKIDELSHNALLSSNLVLVGYVSIRDEIRETSHHAINDLVDAGIQVIMITGDRKETAFAIAKECGIIRNEDDIVITSAEINSLSDEELKLKIPKIRVISRALPQDKYRLVSLTQSLNFVTAMTGDGVNDAPALERSDVGFGMGSGTETAKEAADVVILDDNIQSISKAVLYGRTIFNSIRRFIVFQLTVNVSAVLINLICPAIAPFASGYLSDILQHPLTVTQMLWVNLVMDTLAAIAFGTEPALKRYMKDRPKRRDENIISREMGAAILSGGIYLTAMSLVFLMTPFFKNLIFGDIDVSKNEFLTAYFTFYIFTIIFNMFNARTTKLNPFDNILRNKNFFVVFFGIVAMQLFMTYFGGNIFRCYGLSGAQLAITLGLSFMILPFDIIRKSIARFLFRNKSIG